MSRAMFAASLTYVLVTVVALFVWKPTDAAAEPGVHPATVVAANGFFAAIWAVSGGLFRRAGTVGPGSGQELA